MPGLRHLVLLLRLLVEDRQRLALEDVALRHQLAVLKRSVKRPRIQDSDRMFWILMMRMLKEWREAVHFVKPDTIVRWQYVQVRLACSVGVSPTRGRVRDPVAWIALVKETKLMKSIDKAVHGAVSESPGRNASELIGGLVRHDIRRPSRLPTGEGSTMRRNLADAVRRSGGVVEAAR